MKLSSIQNSTNCCGRQSAAVVVGQNVSTSVRSSHILRANLVHHRCLVVVQASDAAAAPSAPAAAVKPKGFGKVATVPKKEESCPCGSKRFYRECCEPFHTGKATPETAELTLAARFSGFSKNQHAYLLSTDARIDPPRDQLKREYVSSCDTWMYSNLKVKSVEPPATADEAVITFTYNARKLVFEKKTNARALKSKAIEPERNMDGSAKIMTTEETSKFERNKETGAWSLVHSEVLADK